MRHKKGNRINGWIALDKPPGMGSTNALGALKRILKPMKAGHAGTLDPLATGVLPIALGEATKTIPYAQDHLKTYSFAVMWGEQRDTDDAEGAVIASSAHRPQESDIRTALPAFTGDVLQLPPRYSALRVAGHRAYDLAREGQDFVLEPRPVYIESIDLLESCADRALFRVICGKGTYMRSLARDLAQALGTVGHIADLRREAVGPFTLDNAISLDSLEKMEESARLETCLLPLQTVLDDIPALPVNEREAAMMKGGRAVSFISRPDVDRLLRVGIVAADDSSEGAEMVLCLYREKAVALCEVEGVTLHPFRIFNL